MKIAVTISKLVINVIKTKDKKFNILFIKILLQHLLNKL